MTAIEIDGAAYHCTPDQIARDIARQRFIEAQGYAVIRFTGSDMYRRPVKSIYKVRRLINERLHNDKENLPSPAPFTSRRPAPAYTLISPDGIIYTRIADLHAFYIAHKLNYDAVYKLAQGELEEVEG